MYFFLYFYLHLPDGSWRSGSWNMPTTNYSYTLSSSLNVLLLCYDSSGHMTSIRLSILERDPPLLLS